MNTKPYPAQITYFNLFQVPDCRVIVLVDKKERQYIDRLAKRFTLYVVLIQPVDTPAMQDVVEVK